MNALQATEKIRELSERADALARVRYYLGDDRDWSDEVYTLGELQTEIVRERDELADKLRAVNL